MISIKNFNAIMTMLNMESKSTKETYGIVIKETLFDSFIISNFEIANYKIIEAIEIKKLIISILIPFKHPF